MPTVKLCTLGLLRELLLEETARAVRVVASGR